MRSAPRTALEVLPALRSRKRARIRGNSSSHPDHKKAPVKGAFSGLFLGLLSAPVLLISGGMICLTGLGIVLGIPLIIAGICAPLIGSLMGLNALNGKCPWCGADVSGVGNLRPLYLPYL